jgi:hypothetical protein
MIVQLYQQPRLRQTAAAALQQYVQGKLTWTAVTEDILKIMMNPGLSEIRPKGMRV